MNKLLVIIPARAGSKGIPKKNIVDVCGKPLIEYTILPALRLQNHPSVRKVIVSTDSREFADIAEGLGAEVPFLRPAELADDISPDTEYKFHALSFFEERQMTFDAIMTLQPTTPLRTFEDMAAAIEMFNTHNTDSLISVYREDTIRDTIMYTKEGDVAIPLNNSHNISSRRQDHTPIYIRNGAIYITSVAYLKQTRRTISETPLLFEMPKSRSINLDTMEDLKILRWMLRE